MNKKVKVAIVGVGNCASSFVQGLHRYRVGGLPAIGGYEVRDIEVVAAFDVNATKVGLPLSAAIFAEPNCTIGLVRRHGLRGGPTVQRGPTLDGLGQYPRQLIRESKVEPANVVTTLVESGADVVVNYLPVGSQQAAEFYAEAALDAGCAFVNCMPVFLASNPQRVAEFEHYGLPIIGDDIKSQFGATIVHRVLAQLMRDRGVKLKRTSQLNVGGNTDFFNMLERDRLDSKKISKTQAVTSVMGVELPARDVHVGPSDYVEWLDDRKWCHLRLEGEGFGGAPINLELKLEVHDSPNSAGIVIDAVRCAKLALDNEDTGAILEPSAWYMKSPPVQWDDDEAYDRLGRWIKERS